MAWVWSQKKLWLFCRQSFTPYLPHSQEVPISVCLAGMVVMRSTCLTGLQSILSVQLAVAASVWRREDGPDVLVYTFLVSSSTEILIRFIEWTTMAELISFSDHIIHTSLGMRLWQNMADNWYMCAQNIIKELSNIREIEPGLIPTWQLTWKMCLIGSGMQLMTYTSVNCVIFWACPIYPHLVPRPREPRERGRDYIYPPTPIHTWLCLHAEKH